MAWIYGVFPGGDPRKFIPDEETNTPQELEVHRLACIEWNKGNEIVLAPGCLTLGDGSVWDGSGLGLGTYQYDDDEPDDEDWL